MARLRPAAIQHRGPLGLLAVVCALVLGSCGSSAPGSLSALAPPDAPLYAELELRPQGERAEALASTIERVGGIDDPGARIVAALDAELAEADVTYAEDIEPWLGERAALFVRSFEPTELAPEVPDFAVALEVTDTDAARSFLERALAASSMPPDDRDYDGYEYRFDPGSGVAAGVVGDYLIVGTEQSLRVAIDAGNGESLEDSDEFSERVEALPDDPLGLLYVKPGPVAEALAGADAPREATEALQPLLTGPLAEPVAFALGTDGSSIDLDLATVLAADEDGETGSELLGSLPSGSWVAVALPSLGDTLATSLDQIAGGSSLSERFRRLTGLDLERDVTSWLGDTAAFVAGTSPSSASAGVIAETEDPQGPVRLLSAIERLAQREIGIRSGGPPEGASEGFSFAGGWLDGGLEGGVVGDRAAVSAGASTLAEMLDPPATLSADEGYVAALEALGDDVEPELYLDLPTLLAVAELGGAGDDPDYAAAEPYLDAFRALAAGTRVDDGLLVSRLTLTLAD